MGKPKVAMYKGHIECWRKRKRREGEGEEGGEGDGQVEGGEWKREKEKRKEKGKGKEKKRKGNGKHQAWLVLLKSTLFFPRHLCAEVIWLLKFSLPENQNVMFLKNMNYASKRMWTGQQKTISLTQHNKNYAKLQNNQEIILLEECWYQGNSILNPTFFLPHLDLRLSETLHCSTALLFMTTLSLKWALLPWSFIRITQ